VAKKEEEIKKSYTVGFYENVNLSYTFAKLYILRWTLLLSHLQQL
jgi:hypothetical protein